jgi:6-phosphogluconolactonase/glucosamine-6-phosphate isomerase/deaminase
MYDFDTSTKIFSHPTITLYRPKIIQYDSDEMLSIGIANAIVEKTIEISADCGTARLALSNGKTVNDTYKVLAKNHLFPPENTEIYATHEIFTTGKVKEEITKSLTKEKLSEARYYQFINTKLTANKSLAHYNEVLDQFEDDEGFDICVLEVDKNGQFAGIVVGGNGLEGESPMAVQNIINAQKVITISIPTILKSRHIYLVLHDEDDTLEEILQGTKAAVDFPVKILLAHPDVNIFYYLAA